MSDFLGLFIILAIWALALYGVTFIGKPIARAYSPQHAYIGLIRAGLWTLLIALILGWVN